MFKQARGSGSDKSYRGHDHSNYSARSDSMNPTLDPQVTGRGTIIGREAGLPPGFDAAGGVRMDPINRLQREPTPPQHRGEEEVVSVRSGSSRRTAEVLSEYTEEEVRSYKSDGSHRRGEHRRDDASQGSMYSGGKHRLGRHGYGHMSQEEIEVLEAFRRAADEKRLKEEAHARAMKAQEEELEKERYREELRKEFALQTAQQVQAVETKFEQKISSLFVLLQKQPTAEEPGMQHASSAVDLVWQEESAVVVRMRSKSDDVMHQRDLVVQLAEPVRHVHKEVEPAAVQDETEVVVRMRSQSTVIPSQRESILSDITRTQSELYDPWRQSSDPKSVRGNPAVGNIPEIDPFPRSILPNSDIDIASIPKIISFAIHERGLGAEPRGESNKNIVSSLERLEVALGQHVLKHSAVSAIKGIVLVLQGAKFDSDQKTLLHVLSLRPDLSKTLDEFIKAGWKDINCVDLYGYTPLRHAIEKATPCDVGRAKSQDMKSQCTNVDILLKHGADLYAGHSNHQAINFVMEHLWLWKDTILKHMEANKGLKKDNVEMPDSLYNSVASIFEDDSNNVSLHDVQEVVKALGFLWDCDVTSCY